MSAQHHEAIARSCVPHSHSTIIGRGNQPHSIWSESTAADPAFVPAQRVQTFTRGRVPHPQRQVKGGGSDPSSIRCETAVTDVVFMSAHYSQALPGQHSQTR